MKLRWVHFLALIAGALILGLAGAPSRAGAAAEAKTLYTCGMHPQIIQDHPGNCPICGMKLTPVRNSRAADGAAVNPLAIAVDPVTIQNMNLRTATVTNGPPSRGAGLVKATSGTSLDLPASGKSLRSGKYG